MTMNMDKTMYCLDFLGEILILQLIKEFFGHGLGQVITIQEEELCLVMKIILEYLLIMHTLDLTVVFYMIDGKMILIMQHRQTQ